ncbi:MAG: NfeD family protein [Chloroherpetonaceae bacterium]|nr:NfeD family protein [Chloroherpetonaceae bacterium]
MDWNTIDNYWFIAAVILLIIEIVTPGFVLASFSIAAFAAGFCQMIGLGIGFQLFVFAAVSLVTFATLRPIAKKYFYHSKPTIQTGVNAIIGKDAKVIESIQNESGVGRVKILGGEDWKASSLTGNPIHEGSIVEIKRVEGVTLIVEEKNTL